MSVLSLQYSRFCVSWPCLNVCPFIAVLRVLCIMTMSKCLSFHCSALGYVYYTSMSECLSFHCSTPGPWPKCASWPCLNVCPFIAVLQVLCIMTMSKCMSFHCSTPGSVYPDHVWMSVLLLQYSVFCVSWLWMSVVSLQYSVFCVSFYVWMFVLSLQYSGFCVSWLCMNVCLIIAVLRVLCILTMSECLSFHCSTLGSVYPDYLFIAVPRVLCILTMSECLSFHCSTLGSSKRLKSAVYVVISLWRW